jgi:hypothetical protein
VYISSPVLRVSSLKPVSLGRLWCGQGPFLPEAPGGPGLAITQLLPPWSVSDLPNSHRGTAYNSGATQITVHRPHTARSLVPPAKPVSTLSH